MYLRRLTRFNKKRIGFKKLVKVRRNYSVNTSRDEILAFHSNTWCKLVADLVATEAEVPANKLSPTYLNDTYKDQLAKLRNDIPALEKEGVGKDAINRLLFIFQARADMPNEYIADVLNNYKVKRFKESKSPIGTLLPNARHESDVGKIGEIARRNKALGLFKRAKFVVNEVNYGASNNDFLSGLIGLSKAFDNGFTQQQIDAVKAVLSTSTSTAISEKVVRNVVEPDIEKEIQSNDALLLAGKVEQVFPIAEGLDAGQVTEYNSWVDRIKNALVSKPKEIEVFEMISRANPTESQLDAILNVFSEKLNPDLEEANRRLQLNNPIGNSLWGTYISALSNPIVEYTEHYNEGPHQRVKDLENLPQGIKMIDIIRAAETNVSKYNTSDEEILDGRLDRLAGWYGLDLRNPEDSIKFDLFLHEFDVSPGERTLDNIMDYPAIPHTYEELPVTKLPEGETIEENL